MNTFFIFSPISVAFEQPTESVSFPTFIAASLSMTRDHKAGKERHFPKREKWNKWNPAFCLVVSFHCEPYVYRISSFAARLSLPSSFFSAGPTHKSRWIIYGYMLPSKRETCVSVATTHQLFRRSWIKSSLLRTIFLFLLTVAAPSCRDETLLRLLFDSRSLLCASLSPSAAEEKRRKERTALLFSYWRPCHFDFFKENSFSTRRSVECSQTRIYAKIMARLESSSASCRARRRRGRSSCQMQKLCLSHASFDAEIVFNERESDECK